MDEVNEAGQPSIGDLSASGRFTAGGSLLPHSALNHLTPTVPTQDPRDTKTPPKK